MARFLLWFRTIVQRTPHPADVTGRAPERRTHHRALVGTAAWLITDSGSRFDAECVNVSMGGAAVLTNAPLPVRAQVRFELSLGRDRGSVSISCEVVRASASELGLRFLQLDRASLEAVLRLV